MQDGYFGGKPRAIAQTTDGYIWVGTDAGLFQFDGIQFVRWNAPSGEELPSSSIHALLGARDGSLWIGTDAGLAHLVNKRLILYQRGWHVSTIMEDRDRSIWITDTRADDQTHPLCQILESEVHCYGTKEGLDVFGAGPIAQDASGDLWVGSERTFVRWRAGASKVYRPKALQSNEGVDGVGAITLSADGSLWVGIAVPGKGGGLQHLTDGILKPFLVPKLNGETLVVVALCGDHQENLWVGTLHGLYKIRGMDVVHYGSAEGLSGDFVWDIFQDREGNIWVATSEGLDLFRDLRVKSVSAREGLNEDGVESVAAARDGRVWIGTSRLQVLDPKELTWDTKDLPGNQVTSLLVDHAGALWAGIDNKLFVSHLGRFREIKKDDGRALGMIAGIAEDSDRNIWVETAGPPGTLVRIRDLEIQDTFPAPETPLARKIVADPQRGIWLGLVSGDLARFRDGKVQTFVFGEHPSSRVLAITAASDGSILGGTAFGVVAWKNGKEQILTMQNGLPCDYVSGLISDDAGNLWLFAQCGLIEISREQMQLWWEQSESKLNLRVFDTFDGFRPGLGHFNTSAKTADGRLWFANGSVLQVINPTHLSQNTVPPPVHISAAVADRMAYPVDSAIKLPPLTRDLEVDYTALSYATPQKVLFRYMLEGRDASFRDAGTRRQAFYNDLRPGHYRFRVIACNSDGVWNKAGPFLDFSVLPAYYQTAWFRTLCVGAFLALLWAAHRVRIRRLRQQEKKLQEVVETMPTFAWTALPDGSDDFVNRHWHEYSGLSVEESVGSGWQAAVHPADMKPHLEKWHTCLATGEPFQSEVRYRRADGQYRWFLVRAVPLRDRHGKVVKWYGISTDIEDRKRAEQEREQLRADLAHVNRVTTMGELTASLAHEIKQPITASVINAETCLEWLKHDKPDLEEIGRAAASIVQAGRPAGGIIDRLRALYKKAPPQRELVDINEVIREMVLLLRDEAARYAVSIRTDFTIGLPSVSGDRVQLQQVLMNIMLNGIEAMKDTGGVLAVKSELDQDGRVQISISDTGVGLPTDNSDQIFNAFFTTKSSGSGMGLAISRSIIESHDGHLWATRNSGPGATFHFTLPTASYAMRVPVIGV